MAGLISILVGLVLAECARRFCLIFINAFTGPLSKIPGPTLWKVTPLPWMYQNIIGNTPNVTPDLFKKYGKVVRVGPKDVLVADKAGVHKILVEEDLRKSPVYEAVNPHHNISSLITECDKKTYKHKRRLISPGFSIAYLNGLEPLMHECLKDFTQALDSKCAAVNSSHVVDIAHMLDNFTSDVMSATSLGGSFNLIKTDDRRLKGLFLSRLKRAAIDTNLPFVKYLPFVPPPSQDLNNMIDTIVEKRRSEKEPKRDLLQILLDANKEDPVSFSDLHIYEEMILFMIAGSDTTSGTVTFILMQLLNNQDKMNRLMAEMNEVFPSAESQITFSNTQELQYLNAVINEGMRVSPVVDSGLGRITTETTILSDYEIPTGVMVAAFTAAMARDGDIWPDPEKFVPERWLEKYKGVEADRKAFMPFSAGSRNCIGQQFALKETRLILATLLHRYELSLVPGQSHKVRSHTVVYFKQGFYNIGVKQRAKF